MAEVFLAGAANEVQLSVINFVQQAIDDLREGYSTTRKYYRGDHVVKMSKRLETFLRASGTLEFRSNFCEVVVDACAERLNVTSITTGDETVNEYLGALWEDSHADRLQGTLHTETIMQGDGYVLVGWDRETERPRLWFQEPEMVIPHYDPSTGDMVWASKTWKVPRELGSDQYLTYMNAYYPDRIEKYEARGGVWMQRQDEGDEAVWPQPWVDSSKQPLGIPMIHFRNDALSDDFGNSDLSNAIPLQDLLNKQMVDLAQVADVMAFPQRYGVNIEMAERSSFTVVPGAFWDLHGAGAEKDWEVGTFDAAKMTDMLKGIELIVQHIAGTTRTPQHLFQLGLNYPSGEALKTAESGLVSKVKERQVAFGEAWESAMSLAVRLQGAFGKVEVQVPEDAKFTAVWADPETRNEKDHLESLALKLEKLGIPRITVWREAGYSQAEIGQMLEDEKTDQVQTTSVGGAILDEFRRGLGPDEEQDGEP
tara:strand:+ start:321 stop:1763 length:1443 start_codon:yes stop_codon:yes gene_type:complete